MNNSDFVIPHEKCPPLPTPTPRPKIITDFCSVEVLLVGFSWGNRDPDRDFGNSISCSALSIPNFNPHSPTATQPHPATKAIRTFSEPSKNRRKMYGA